MILRIKPMRVGKYIEPCMLEIKGEQKDSEFYPVAVVHVDNFWQGREGGNQVYNLLQSEKVVEIEISLTPRALDSATTLPDESDPRFQMLCASIFEDDTPIQ